jgi:hypothetical protein
MGRVTEQDDPALARRIWARTKGGAIGNDLSFLGHAFSMS